MALRAHAQCMAALGPWQRSYTSCMNQRRTVAALSLTLLASCGSSNESELADAKAEIQLLRDELGQLRAQLGLRGALQEGYNPTSARSGNSPEGPRELAERRRWEPLYMESAILRATIGEPTVHSMGPVVEEGDSLTRSIELTIQLGGAGLGGGKALEGLIGVMFDDDATMIVRLESEGAPNGTRPDVPIGEALLAKLIWVPEEPGFFGGRNDVSRALFRAASAERVTSWLHTDVIELSDGRTVVPEADARYLCAEGLSDEERRNRAAAYLERTGIDIFAPYFDDLLSRR